MSIADKLRTLFSNEPTIIGGKRLVSRTDAAKVCAKVLPTAGVLGVPFAPRGDAGRVCVVLAHVTANQRLAFGWIEIPLNGDVTLTLDESAIAAAAAPRVRQIIAAAFAGLAVRPVPPDPRSWTFNDHRIVQAATGLWTVVGPQGAPIAAADTPEDAVRAARSPEVREQPAGVRAEVAELLIEMERDHAARWVAKQLREHGYEVRVERDTIALDLHGFAAGICVAPEGLVFDARVPTLARTVAEAALRRVDVVERLE
jgi:hypothetical protein